MAYVYILKSKKDSKLYIGGALDLDLRLQYHSQGKVRSTKSRRPLSLIYKEELGTITQDRKRGNYLKSGHGREWIKKLLFGGEVSELV